MISPDDLELLIAAIVDQQEEGMSDWRQSRARKLEG
jgi:hypothetical protein